MDCTIRQDTFTNEVLYLVDTGATGYGFIHRDLARKWKLRLTPLSTVLRLDEAEKMYLGALQGYQTA